MQWMSKWKMTREEITQTMIKWKRKKTGRTLIKRQTKIRKGKHEKASRCFKQIHQDRLPASACCFCKGIVPRSWNGNPNFLETFATWGCSFFVVRFCTAKGCWFRMKFNGKKTATKSLNFPEQTSFVWEPGFVSDIGPLSIRCFFRPSWKLRLDLLDLLASLQGSK